MALKKLFLIFCFFIMFAMPAFSENNIKVGELYHITGCENGEKLINLVNVWDKPGGLAEGARLVGKLFPTEKKKCIGEIVIVNEVKDGNLKIKSIKRGISGWITESFIKKKFNPKKCSKYYSDEIHIKRCENSLNEDMIVTLIANSNLYSLPGGNKIIKKLVVGSQHIVIDFLELKSGKISNIWYKIKSNDLVGWISEHSTNKLDLDNWKVRNKDL